MCTTHKCIQPNLLQVNRGLIEIKGIFLLLRCSPVVRLQKAFTRSTVANSWTCQQGAVYLLII